MFEKRLKKIQKSLTPNKIDSLIISSAVNIAYLTGYSNFSRHEREVYLFVTETNAMLFTDGRYIEAVRNMLPKGIKVFLHTELFKKMKSSKAKKIGIEPNFTVAELKRFKKETGLKFVLAEPIVENLRAIKDDDEIKNIRAACYLTDKAYSHVLENIRMNISEKEVAWRIEKFIKEKGVKLAFEPIVAFGANSAIPHHKTSNKQLTKSDQFVLLDFGAKVNNYCSDMTRILLMKASSDRAKKIYQAVFDAQSAACRSIDRSTLSYKSVQASAVAKVANQVMVKKGFREIPHGLGHGIGLEVHELPSLSPKSKDKLVRNSIFTIEPGIYIPGFGGVRIEDDFLLSDKLERLTRSPQELLLLNL